MLQFFLQFHYSANFLEIVLFVRYLCISRYQVKYPSRTRSKRIYSIYPSIMNFLMHQTFFSQKTITYAPERCICWSTFVQSPLNASAPLFVHGTFSNPVANLIQVGIFPFYEGFNHSRTILLSVFKTSLATLFVQSRKNVVFITYQVFYHSYY